MAGALDHDRDAIRLGGAVPSRLRHQEGLAGAMFWTFLFPLLC
jgi:hypothetical protein